LINIETYPRKDPMGVLTAETMYTGGNEAMMNFVYLENWKSLKHKEKCLRGGGLLSCEIIASGKLRRR
jgi:hypothetical protein